MKRLILFLAILVPALANATNEVNITVSGSGTDKETAIKIALRSALEQTYGTFVATNTKILNDKLVSDEIVSLSRGNIKSYSILSEKQINNGHWYVLLNVVVNINQLVSYVHGQGSSVEVDMDAFSAKVQMEELNKNAERKIIEGLIAEIEAIDLWDYSLELDEPAVSGDKYLISGVIKVKYNANTCAAVKLLMDVFAELDISSHPDNIVKGRTYYEYAWGCRFPNAPTLRNVYDNGLLCTKFEYGSRDNYGIQPHLQWRDATKSLFLRKIRFVIDPLMVKIDGNNTWLLNNYKRPNEESKSYISQTRGSYELHIDCGEADYTYCAKGYNLSPHSIGDVIFTIHFKKELSREEALKIKKITVRPL